MPARAVVVGFARAADAAGAGVARGGVGCGVGDGAVWRCQALSGAEVSVTAVSGAKVSVTALAGAEVTARAGAEVTALAGAEVSVLLAVSPSVPCPRAVSRARATVQAAEKPHEREVLRLVERLSGEESGAAPVHRTTAR